MYNFSKNIFGVSDARCGSSYLFDAISNAMKVIDPKHHYIGEGFHPEWLENMIFINEDGNLDSDRSSIKKISGLNRPWVPYYHRYDVQKSTAKCLLEANNTWSLKLFPPHYETASHKIIHRVINKKTTHRLFLYRNDIEDKVLSKIFANETSIYKSKDENKLKTVYDDLEISYNGSMYWDIIQEFVKNTILLKNRFKEYNWDSVFIYEELVGEPSVDLEPIFKEETKYIWDKVESRYFKKQLTKEEKLKRFKNYSGFRRDLESALDLYGATEKDLIL